MSTNSDESSDETYLTLDREVGAFLASFDGLSDAPYDELRRALYALERAEEGLASLKAQPLPNGPSEEDIHEREACEARLSTLSARHDELVREIATLQAQVQHADELSVQIEVAKAERTESIALRDAYRKKLDIVRMTKSYLAEARDAMTSKYLSGTRDEFYAILRELGEEPEQFRITTSFEISKEEAGSLRPSESFSRGQRDLFALAARFALVRVLYPKEMPFVVLDDPFAALDDKRLSLAMQYLKKLSESTQILYLTCSEARAKIQ